MVAGCRQPQMDFTLEGDSWIGLMKRLPCHLNSRVVRHGTPSRVWEAGYSVTDLNAKSTQPRAVLMAGDLARGSRQDRMNTQLVQGPRLRDSIGSKRSLAESDDPLTRFVRWSYYTCLGLSVPEVTILRSRRELCSVAYWLSALRGRQAMARLNGRPWLQLKRWTVEGWKLGQMSSWRESRDGPTDIPDPQDVARNCGSACTRASPAG